jgi:hypothetical protein
MSERSLTDLEVRTFGREGDVWKKLVFLCVFLALNSCTAGVGENEDVAETTEAEAAGQVRDGLKITHADWTTFCKFAVTFVAVAGCVAVAGGCGTAEVITIGGATLPCVMVVALLCNAHAGTGALLADRCHIAMDLR